MIKYLVPLSFIIGAMVHPMWLSTAIITTIAITTVLTTIYSSSKRTV